MRMHSHRGEDVFVMLGDFDGSAIVLDGSDRADRDQLPNTGLRSALDHRLDVIAELRVGEMAMRIDDHVI